MKKIIFNLVAFVFISFQLSANISDPVIEKCCPVVVHTSAVDFAYDEDLYSTFFSPAYFNEKTNSLHFEAFQKINFIKIFNEEGSMVYKLPVLSNKVRISKNLFEQGDYKVEFEIEGESDSLPAYVTIN